MSNQHPACPFCGSDNLLEFQRHSIVLPRPETRIKCRDCGAQARADVWDSRADVITIGDVGGFEP